MKNIFSIIFVFIFLISCSKEKFNSQTWKTVDGLYQGHRKAMLTDLMDNHLKLGMKYEQVENLIGEAEKIDECTSNYIYIIEEKIGMIDPNGHMFFGIGI